MTYATISIVLPVHNAAATLPAALASLEAQTYAGPIEVCAYDDHSGDGSVACLRATQVRWAAQQPGKLTLKVATAEEAGASTSLGAGFARNRAASMATGQFLAWLDADDVCLPHRLAAQLARLRASEHPERTLIGGGFTRLPEGATPVYTAWANALPDDHAVLAAAAWREVPLIQPTWFMPRSWFVALGGYEEVPPDLASLARGSGGEETLRFVDARELELAAAPPGAAESASSAGAARHPPILGRPPRKLAALTTRPSAAFPEDTVFMARHLAAGGRLGKVPEPLLTYVFSPSSQSWLMPRELLLRVRVALWEEAVLWADPASSAPAEGWAKGGFVIWSAGRDGKAFYKALSPAAAARVVCFLDVDERKIGQMYPMPQRRAAVVAAGGGPGESKRRRVEGGAAAAPAPAPRPIVHFLQAPAGRPIVCCVSHDSGGPQLQANVAALSAALASNGAGALVDGANFVYFV